MEYPKSSSVASSTGYSSDPATTTTTEEAHDHDRHAYLLNASQASSARPASADNALLHPLRSSDASNTNSNLSLHASQRLQSTPGGGGKRAGLHRVYRTAASSSPRPITSSVTDSSDTGTIANSSVSLSSAEDREALHIDSNDLPLAYSSRNNNNHNHNSITDRSSSRGGPLAIRDYWNSLVLDLEGAQPHQQPPSVSAPHGLLRPAESGRVTHAPSTGSSATLVEQELDLRAAIRKEVPISSQHSSLNELSAARTSPLNAAAAAPSLSTAAGLRDTADTPNGSGMSRFAVAAAHVEQSYRHEDSRSASDNRSSTITPQQHSYLHDSAAREADSEVASRVHDIFRRHIHNASTSYASRRSSLHESSRSVATANTSATATQGPRHRLRDLLDRESRVDRHEQRAESRRSRPSHTTVRKSTDRDITPIAHETLSGIHGRSNVSRQGSATPVVGRFRSGDRSQSADAEEEVRQRYVAEQSALALSQQESSSSHSISRLSREWRELSARATQQHLQDERSMGLSMELAMTDEEAEVEEELQHDGDIEDHQPEGGNIVQRVTRVAIGANAPTGDTGRGHVSALAARDTAEKDSETDEEDFLPSDIDLPSEEEYSAGHISQTPKTRSQQALLASQVSPSPARTQGSASRTALRQSLLVPESNATIYASPSRQRHLFRSPSKPQTPPKTPHLPGHYMSTTPFISAPRATDVPLGNGRDASLLGSPSGTLAQGISNMSIAVPQLPGGYISPFPHPRRQQAQVIEEAPAKEEFIASAPARKTDRFSAMLQKVIEEREEEAFEAAAPVAGPSTPSQVRLGMSPSAKSPRRSSTSARQLSKSPMKIESPTAPDTSAQVDAQSTDRTLEAAETSIQSALVDIGKPLRNLLDTFGSPNRPSLSSGHDQEHAGDISLDARNQREAQRRTVRSQQDAILKKLREADQLDQSLAGRLEELKAAFEDMSSKFTTQVSSVLHENFAKEGRRRKMWLLSLVFIELLLVWALFRFADARANLAYQTTYFDPFFPELYTPSSISLTSAGGMPADAAGLLSTKSILASGDTSARYLDRLNTLFRASTSPLFNGFPAVTELLSRQRHGSVQNTMIPTNSASSASEMINQFLAVIKTFYQQLLSLGLGQTSFPYGTLGRGSIISGAGAGSANTISWSAPPRGKMYRIPT